MNEDLENIKARAAEKKKENQRFFRKLKSRPPKNLDGLMQELHTDEFERTDCLECANCCKTTGPLFTPADVDRISGKLRMKPGDFVDEYLRTDEEGDLVLQEVPCRFLAADNACLIYDFRPKACREYPHTDRRKFHQIGSLTIKNTAICPAAFRIVESLKQRLPEFL
ncbi:hypothetical protein SAMN04490243_2706 [Robiginitalea myxolifaciens]|uniref:Uncharacterized protein n=1 Tax=Robiginitalea myxolifaciens TaxID=400055 RepID=A0A1I6HG09_9FLAO|nr:YkgJ family cysteine cluster protein [Robiginitalea myxolifaciens]SFR53423.1 hypothetical protein SAMN04490243_2706 [Robiginitalea myxolifaciens]